MSGQGSHGGAAGNGSRNGTVTGGLRGGSTIMAGAQTLGTTRNRTDLFVKYRNQARGSRPSVPGEDGRESSR